MKISYNWLKWYIPDAPTAETIADVITYHLTEVEGVVLIRADGSIETDHTSNGISDWIFDVNILPNRAHDLLSHQGFAKELSGQLGIKFNDPTELYKIPESKPTNLKIEINSIACRRYMGRIIRNVKVGPSPEWVVKHLESIGQRSINNIVDATNIVMYDCGQPCHAYDLKKLAEEKIVIKNAKEGEELPVVGREEIIAKLKDTDLVITDGVQSLALAGVKGGLNSGINESTTDIVLEVANFDPTTVRKTARRLGLLSDSAKRFENDLSPEHTAYAMRELSALFLDPLMNCPDSIFEEIVDVYPVTQEEKKISFTTELVNKKLGGNITDVDIEKILKNYNFIYTLGDNFFEVEIPLLRLDLENPIDMIEEIGRIYGYEKLLPIIPKINFTPQINDTYSKINSARAELLADGYREVMTYAFANKGQVEVLASASDKNFLRTNLSDGLKKSYDLNKLNIPLLGLNEVKIFEIGSVFKNDPPAGAEEIKIVTADKKGVIEKSLREYTTSLPQPFTGNERELALSIKQEKAGDGVSIFKPWSPYPFITRDISVWVPQGFEVQKLVDIYIETAANLLIKEPYQVDMFTKPASSQGGDSRISYAYRLIFQVYDRTLTDEEVSLVMKKIEIKIKEISGLEVR